MRLVLFVLALAACGSASPSDTNPTDLAMLGQPDLASPAPDLAPRICTFDVDTFDGECQLAP